MTLLAPGYLLAGALAALAVVALHFIVTREPRTQLLPTARFAPDLPAVARPRAVSPRDLLLMLIRMMMVLAVGAALAQPVIAPRRAALRRIILADHSPAALAASETDDSVRSFAGPGDSIIPFDSVRLSAALVQAMRAAVALRERSDSLELVLVSPLLAAQLDEAVDSIRALWPGAVRLVRTSAAAATRGDSLVRLDGAAADPLRWPASDSGEAIGGVTAGGVTVIAPLRRRAPMSVPPGARVVARWIDGRPAAFEQHVGQGCHRRVEILVPSRGDLVLSRRFEQLAAILSGPCGAPLSTEPAPPSRERAIAQPDLPSRVAAGALPVREAMRSNLSALLLVLAFVLAIAEWALRR